MLLLSLLLFLSWLLLLLSQQSTELGALAHRRRQHPCTPSFSKQGASCLSFSGVGTGLKLEPSLHMHPQLMTPSVLGSLAPQEQCCRQVRAKRRPELVWKTKGQSREGQSLTVRHTRMTDAAVHVHTSTEETRRQHGAT